MLIYSQFFESVWPSSEQPDEDGVGDCHPDEAKSQKPGETKPWDSALIEDLNISNKLKAVLDEPDNQNKLQTMQSSALMNILESLEEKNLFLIQQGQENEQMIEEKKQKLIETKHNLQHKFNNLEKRELETLARTEKTKIEFANIKAETVKEDTKTISQATFDHLTEKTKEILGRFGMKKQDNKNMSLVQMLLELERKIEDANATLTEFQSTEANRAVYIKARDSVKTSIRTENNQATLDKQNELKELQNAKQLERQKDRNVIRDKHPPMPIHAKKRIPRKEVKKIDLTQEQQDMKKYGGEALF